MRFMRLSCQTMLTQGVLPTILLSCSQGNWIVLSMNGIGIMGGRLSSPDLKNGARQWILAFQIFQNAIRKRLWKYRKTGFFFILFSTIVQCSSSKQHLCGTKTNQKCIRLFLLSVIRRCDADDSLFFFNLPRETNRLLASRLLLQSVVQQSEIFSGSAILFENYSKCRIWIFAFSTEFCPILKLTCLVTLFDRKLQVFKNLPKLTIFGIFN